MCTDNVSAFRLSSFLKRIFKIGLRQHSVCLEQGVTLCGSSRLRLDVLELIAYTLVVINSHLLHFFVLRDRV